MVYLFSLKKVVTYSYRNIQLHIMARQSGVVQFTGRIGDLSFYHHKLYGYIARRKGGADKERISKDPQFERTRENASEFGAAVQAAKLIRHSVKGFLHVTGDPTVTQRLNRVAVAVAKLDTEHARGERVFASGLTHPAAGPLLRSFAFHEANPLSYILPNGAAYAAMSGVFTLQGLMPGQDIAAPKQATHVRLQGFTGLFDFEAQRCRPFVTPAVTLALNADSEDIVLAPDVVPEGTGVPLAFLSVVFLQEQNGELYVLRQGMAVGIINS